MAEFFRESKLDPSVLISQEMVLDLADLIHSASLAYEDDCIEVPTITAADLEKNLAKIGLAQLLVVGSDELEPDASVGKIELYAELDTYQMFVKDMVNGKNPEGEIPVDNAVSRSANIGIIVPYTGVDEYGYGFMKDHHIVVSADSTDDLPSISSWLDIQIIGKAADRSVITNNTRPMSTEQSFAFVAITKEFYLQATNRKSK